jgi:hypothetical protein
MGAVTYPNPEVINFVRTRLVPVQVLSNSKPLPTDFNIQWTPTMVVLDSSGKEHHRVVGFLSPEEFIPAMLLGIAKCAFDTGDFKQAISTLEELLTKYPMSDAAPEAIYIRGVATYKSTHDPKPLKNAYEKLQAKYPASEWTKRAYPYRLL